MPSVNLLGRVANTGKGKIYMDIGKKPRLVRVAIGNTSFILDLNDATKCRNIGEGGQGIVYGLALDGSRVIKIIDPLRCHGQLVNVQSILETHSELYTALGKVASVPLWLVYDATNLHRQVVGYGMASLEGWSNLLNIRTPHGARELGVGFRDVAEIFAALHNALSVIHKHGFVVGDLNARNVMFKKVSGRYEVRVIDVDTWSINRPDLGHVYFSDVINLNDAAHPEYQLAAKAGRTLPHPERNYDWWAFSYHLYRSITKHDPFRAGACKDSTFDRRARIINGVTTMSPDVDRLGVDQSAALGMGTDLLAALETQLRGIGSGPFPVPLIADLYRGAVVCGKCRKETYRDPAVPTPSCHCGAQL